MSDLLNVVTARGRAIDVIERMTVFDVVHDFGYDGGDAILIANTTGEYKGTWSARFYCDWVGELGIEWPSLMALLVELYDTFDADTIMVTDAATMRALKDLHYDKVTIPREIQCGEYDALRDGINDTINKIQAAATAATATAAKNIVEVVALSKVLDELHADAKRMRHVDATPPAKKPPKSATKTTGAPSAKRPRTE